MSREVSGRLAPRDSSGLRYPRVSAVRGLELSSMAGVASTAEGDGDRSSEATALSRVGLGTEPEAGEAHIVALRLGRGSDGERSGQRVARIKLAPETTEFDGD